MSESQVASELKHNLAMILRDFMRPHVIEIVLGKLPLSKWSGDDTVALGLLSRALAERDCYALSLEKIVRYDDKDAKAIAKASLRNTPRYAHMTVYVREMKRRDDQLDELKSRIAGLEADLVDERAKTSSFLRRLMGLWG